MKSDVTYDLVIIGGGISACVFASQYLKSNITKKVDQQQQVMKHGEEDDTVGVKTPGNIGEGK